VARPVRTFKFLLPGILVQTVLLITSYTGFNLNTDFSKGVADRFRSLPVWRLSVIVGALFGDAARYTLASVIVLLLGLVLGFRPEGGVVGVLLSVALILVFAFSLSWIWTALGLVLRTPNSVLWVSTLIVFPLTFASNIFVEPKTMPGWLQTAVVLNPITHLVTAVRGLMSGTVLMGQISWLLAAAPDSSSSSPRSRCICIGTRNEGNQKTILKGADHSNRILRKGSVSPITSGVS
jgi:daunorubicin/doxorubicin transport system permease protein